MSGYVIDGRYGRFTWFLKIQKGYKMAEIKKGRAGYVIQEMTEISIPVCLPSDYPSRLQKKVDTAQCLVDAWRQAEQLSTTPEDWNLDREELYQKYDAIPPRQIRAIVGNEEGAVNEVITHSFTALGGLF